MYFNVKFITEDRSDIIEAIGKPGIDMLDEVRATYPILANVWANGITINNECPISSSKHTVTMTEDDARKSGKFNGTTKVKVIVPYGYLTKYVSMDARFYYTETNKSKIPWLYNKIERHVSSAVINFVIDTKRIINEWIEAGSPERWGFDE